MEEQHPSKFFNFQPSMVDEIRLRDSLDIDAHIFTTEQLCDRYDTNVSIGISHATARKRMDKSGLNELSPPRPKNFFLQFSKHLKDGFSILLWIGAILSFISYFFDTKNAEPDDSLYMGILLVIVVFISACFTFYHEQRSIDLVKSFRSMIPHYTNVVRAGEGMRINSSVLVVGDVIVLEAGDRVPADVCIFESSGHKVDNSVLTGDITPQAGSAKYTSRDPLLTENLAFFGTNIVQGRARGIVIATGDRTVLGRSRKRVIKLVPHETLIAMEVNNFIKVITIMAVIPAITFFFVTLLMGYNWLKSFIFMTAIIVSNVPEGLLATVTTCLAVTGQRMIARNCLIKQLDSIEALGSTSIILSDQTGTLTQNRMTVKHFWYDDQLREVECRKTDAQNDDVALGALVTAAVLCSRAEYCPGQENMPIAYKKTIGDATETAVLKCMELQTGNMAAFRADYPLLGEIPFNSTNKYHVSVHATKDKLKLLLVMKGAPEIVIKCCSTVLLGGKSVKLTEVLIAGIEEVVKSLAMLGERVLGYCDYELSAKLYSSSEDLEKTIKHMTLVNFRFVGMISMLDPVRSSVPDAVSKCRTGGIKVIMISGEHPETAKTVAKCAGIIKFAETVEDISERLKIPVEQVNAGDAKAIIVKGDDLDKMSRKELDTVLSKHTEIVIARAVREHKLRIIDSCHRQGHIVAVTGERVNDAPALRMADIGIALAVNGTDISRDAASVILLDDNFASIIAGIEAGRLVFDNLKKSIAYTLMTNMPEITPLFAFVLYDIPLPLGAITIFCIDLGTEMMPSISLAYEKPEKDLMQRQPRNPEQSNLVNERMISYTYGQIGFIQALGGFFAYFVVMGENGFLPNKLFGLRKKWYSRAINDLEDSYGQEWTYDSRRKLGFHSHTAFFIAMVVMQWADLIICKTLRRSVFKHGMRNEMLNFALVFETLVAIFLCYAGMEKFLQMYPIKFRYWFTALPFSLLIFVYDEIRKYLIRRFPGGFVERETYY